MLKRWILSSLFVLLVTSSQNIAKADVVSLESDYIAGQTDLTGQLNRDRHGLTDGVNNIRGVYSGSVQSSGQIKADTVGEENMADDANPRVRTNEGAACPDFVVSGLLPATSSSLILTIPTGIAYPDGYRVEKTSSTAATLQASKWTWYYILTSGSFATNVGSIGSSTPTAPANSALLFRASTDTSTINTITDLRKTSCTAGPFSAISDTSGEATLDDLLKNGAFPRRFSSAGRTPEGYARGFFVSYNTVSTFKVTPGAAYINGKYRAVSTETTITTSNDDPSNGISGLDTGSVTGGPLNYCVYAVADQDNVKTASFTYSTNCTAPTGVTNAHLIGSIRTDATNLFTSRDVVTSHGISDYEMPFAWLRMEGNAGAPKIMRSFNIASLTENATGAWTATFNSNPTSADYVVVGSCGSGGSSLGSHIFTEGTITSSSAKFFCINTGNSGVTTPDVFVQFIGDNRK